MPDKIVWLLGIVVSIQLITLVWAFIRPRQRRGKRTLPPRVILLSGTFLTALILFFGTDYLLSNKSHTAISFLRAVHNTFRIFVISLPPDEFLEYLQSRYALECNHAFAIYVQVLFLFAPCLTFELVLSAFSNTHAHIRLLFSVFSEKCVFSELNEKTIVLAESIYENDHSANSRKPRRIIFHNVKKTDEEAYSTLLERSRAIGAILFTGSITSIKHHSVQGKQLLNLRHKQPHVHSQKHTVPKARDGVHGSLSFFIMGKKHEDNVQAAIQIKKDYSLRSNTTLYIFSSSVIAEVFACTRPDEKIDIRRIDENRSLIYRTLYDMEMSRINHCKPDLFSTATGGAVKTISAAIIGMGNYGEEMLKALTWFGQMPGYRIKIDAFDTDPSVADRLCAACPELLSHSDANASNDNDSQYEISIHTINAIESSDFVEQINGINNVTYAFVALPSDEETISAAVQLRKLFEQKRIHPLIHAVVLDSNKAVLLQESTNFKNQKYDIQCIGDLKSMYSEQVIINSELESEALQVHIEYGLPSDYEMLDEEQKQKCIDELKRQFFAYEYLYRSSSATALHLKAKIACGLQGADINEDAQLLIRLEKRRWNAYMRTDGYSFSGSLDRASRNDLAKLHNLLVPFDMLPVAEQAKDKHVSLFLSRRYVCAESNKEKGPSGTRV